MVESWATPLRIATSLPVQKGCSPFAVCLVGSLCDRKTIGVVKSAANSSRIQAMSQQKQPTASLVFLSVWSSLFASTCRYAASTQDLLCYARTSCHPASCTGIGS